MKIIVIDDDADARKLIRLTLQIDNHETLEAENGEQGLLLIQTHLPDLIISDIKMPIMNGIELFQALKCEESFLDVIPFIFISSDVTESEMIEHLNGGADNCFQKPINLALLRGHVNSYLASTKRYSSFFKRKLDDIASNIGEPKSHEFSEISSLSENVEQYVLVINAAIDALHVVDQLDATRRADQKPLDYVRFCLNQLERRRQLVQSVTSEILTWWLIFTVAESQYAGESLYVSDLYVSAPSAKTTINSRIVMLVDEGVLEKHTPSNDGRRQKIELSPIFNESLNEHIRESFEVLNDVIAM